jgi:hypothetical protein
MSTFEGPSSRTDDPTGLEIDEVTIAASLLIGTSPSTEKYLSFKRHQSAIPEI